MKTLDAVRLEENINRIAKYDFDNKKVFGCAYHVYQKDNLEIEKCFGVTSVEKGKTVTGDTVFRLASMTKPVTGFAAMILCDRGLIHLEDPDEKYLPEFADIRLKDSDGNDLGAPNVKPIIRHILTHSSGIGSDFKKISTMQPEDKATRDAHIDFFFENRTRF